MSTDLSYIIRKGMSAKPVIDVIKAAPSLYMREDEEDGQLIRHLENYEAIQVNVEDVTEREDAFSRLSLDDTNGVPIQASKFLLVSEKS